MVAGATRGRRSPGGVSQFQPVVRSLARGISKIGHHSMRSAGCIGSSSCVRPSGEDDDVIQPIGMLVIAFLVLLGLAGCNGGSQSAAQPGCSLETLKGHYIYAYDGFNVTGLAAADRLPFASAGHETY